MKNKGFTLVELTSIIILLGVLSLVVISGVSGSLKKGKNDLYNAQIENIKLGMESWANANSFPKFNEFVVLSLSQLKEAGYVASDLTNPLNNELFPNDMVLKIKNVSGNIEYEINETGINKSEYKNLPKMKLKGKTLEYVEINSNYNDLGVTAKNYHGDKINDISINVTPTLDLSVLGIYTKSYTATFNNISNTIYRTIVVTDTTKPVITFNGSLVLTMSEALNYDFTRGVVVTDNSNSNCTLEVSNNSFPIPGKYTIKYTANDMHGNQATKLREVLIKE